METWLIQVCGGFLVLVCTLAAAQKTPLSDPTHARSTSCGLDGFDIDTLTKASYWSVNIITRTDLSKCILPNGYDRHHITGCKLFFSVCKPIPKRVCHGHTNSTTCQEVTTRDGHKHYYSTGHYQGNSEFKPTAGHKSDGFSVVRHGGTVSSRSCDGPYTTALKWVCNKDMVWKPHSHDASPYIHHIIQKDDNTCHLNIVFGYSGACQAASSLQLADHCLLPPYNLTDLRSRDYWYARVPNNFCYNDNNFRDVHLCNFTFTFCQPLPVKDFENNCSGAAVCQSGLMDDDRPPWWVKTFSYSMGRFKNSTRFNYNNNEMVGGGFYVDVENGAKLEDGKCQNGIKTRIVLSCNSSAKWSNQDLSDIIHVVESVDHCEYSLMLPYDGACLPVFPNASTIVPSTTHGMTPLTTPTTVNATSLIHVITPSMNVTHATTRGMMSLTTPTTVINATSLIHVVTPSMNATTSGMTSLTTPTTMNSTTHGTAIKSTTHVVTMTTRHATALPTFTLAPPTPVPTMYVVTTQPAVDPDRKLIIGLSVGVVLFGVFCVVVLVLIIVSAQFCFKRRNYSQLEFIREPASS